MARIPQSSGIDSLNAAMAGTVALYEARRQRGG
jgi:tRNA G18 (ribose-2'-O)-methylase SpoU